MGSKIDRERLYGLLRRIPPGKVTTYGQLAQLLGNNRFARGVGSSLHANLDGDKTPCYKVVNCRGELSKAYAFGGLAAQKQRLEAEGVSVIDGRVDLDKVLWDGRIVE